MNTTQNETKSEVQETSRQRAIKTVLLSVGTMISVNFVSEALKISLLSKPTAQVQVSVAMDDKNQLHIQSTSVNTDSAGKKEEVAESVKREAPKKAAPKKSKKTFKVGEYKVKTVHRYNKSSGKSASL